jgi:hypothetical protein
MGKPTRAQSQEIMYELHTLGWKSFQDLCVTIVSEVFGQTVQAFLPSHDGGRDGAFHGHWSNLEEGGVKGSYTVQCKFSSRPAGKLSLALLSDEIEKAKRLAKRGLANNYVLMSNMGLSGSAEEEIRKVFLGIPGIEWFAIFGSTWITLRIRENSRLRMLVPRVYGLGDLSQILDERAYVQAQEILKAIGHDLSKFVITDAHRQSAKALLKHGFVLLLGEPASGKSTIAATLSLGALDVWGCSTLRVLDAQGFVDHWNPNEPRQFFWVDDVFGTTQYQKDTTLAWNKTFSHLNAAIKKGSRVIFTSRDYVFENARRDIKMSAFPLLNDSQVIINVQDLTSEEKKQILYNHIKLGDQPRSFKTKIKPYLAKVATSKRFLPEIARRLGTTLFTKQLVICPEFIEGFVEHPLEFLVEVVESLDTHAKASLAFLFMRGGTLESPIELSKEERTAIERLGSNLASMRVALNAMKGSLVLFIPGSVNRWQFKHPTIADAIGEIIARDAELIDVYLSGTPSNKLVREITCGRVDMRGAKVVVPRTRYSLVSEKLHSLKDRRSLYSFLAYRCDDEFLNLYLERHPQILEEISSIGSYLSAVPEVSLLTSLHKRKFLPEHLRVQFVMDVSKLAVDTPDSDFLSDASIRSMFKSNEIDMILTKVRTELLPHLEKTIENWRWNYSRSEDPQSYFEPLIDALRTFAGEFDAHDEVHKVIEDGLSRIDQEIQNLLCERDEEEDYSELSSSSGPLISEHGDRSIFDDVDE